jgi:hypothetical protein
MGPSGVIEALDISAKRSPRLRDAGIGLQVNLLVFAGPPEPFHENIVPPDLDDIRVDIELGASLASVFSPLPAASATFALKAGQWFPRGGLVMASPVHGITPHSGRKYTYHGCSDCPRQIHRSINVAVETFFKTIKAELT